MRTSNRVDAVSTQSSQQRRGRSAFKLGNVSDANLLTAVQVVSQPVVCCLQFTPLDLLLCLVRFALCSDLRATTDQRHRLIQNYATTRNGGNTCEFVCVTCITDSMPTERHYTCTGVLRGLVGYARPLHDAGSPTAAGWLWEGCEGSPQSLAWGCMTQLCQELGAHHTSTG